MVQSPAKNANMSHFDCNKIYCLGLKEVCITSQPITSGLFNPQIIKPNVLLTNLCKDRSNDYSGWFSVVLPPWHIVIPRWYELTDQDGDGHPLATRYY